MGKSRRDRLILRDPAQREALASTVRMELLEHLFAAGPTTVAELAERMGRTPHSLYHHFRRLKELKLIRQVDDRRSGARTQAVYDVVAERFELSVEPGDANGYAPERKTAGVILRQAEREFDQALETDPESLQNGEFFVGRARARLSRSAQKAVHRHLQAILRIFAEEFSKTPHPRSRVRTCSFTVAFVPSPSGNEPTGE